MRGDLGWSLFDNYEWALGSGPRFGLCATDCTTQARAAAGRGDFARVCRTGRLD